MKKSILLLALISSALYSFSQDYKIVDTSVDEFYSNTTLITEPLPGSAFYGQDGNYSGFQPSYTDNGDGTISDNITGLMWQKEMGIKISYSEAYIKADTLTVGGYTDWRVPTIKELYSLINFTGRVMGEVPYAFFIDTLYFNQPLGDTTIGERLIDAQTWSSTQYTGLTMAGDSTVFGVNFVDGRIKGYPKYEPFNQSVPMTMYFRMVRGNPLYGINNFVDNNNGTVSDLATGLMWQKADNGNFYDWQGALDYAENLVLSGYSDWRLPNAKELQSIVDYTRCPQVTSSAAIDPVFVSTEINDPDGNPGQYPYYWTGTNHQDGTNPFSSAVYIAFGEAQGKMNNQLMDVHGAGAQRSDPKSGNPADYPAYFGPQGDVRYVFNAVRCVRDNVVTEINDNVKTKSELRIYPNPVIDKVCLSFDHTYLSVSLEIVSVTGQVVYKALFNNLQDITIDLNGIESGFYFINTNADEQVLKSGLIKIER